VKGTMRTWPSESTSRTSCEYMVGSCPSVSPFPHQ
jgi:hypothetical protein